MSVTLYIVRHAIAGIAPPGMSDADREITVAGRARMVRAVRGLKRLGIAPARIVTSPLKRAHETATLLAAGLALGRAIDIDDALAPGYAPADVIARLRRYRGARSLVLVGHEPQLSRLLSQLLTGSPSTLASRFRKGGVAAVEISGLTPHGHGTLLWLATPKQLRAIGR